MKPKVAIFDFASCEGCELQIANLEEDILEIVERVDIVSFREVMKEHSDVYDIAFVEGSVNRPIDAERLKDIRSRAKILVAMGDCACTGCVNKLRNDWSVDNVKKEVYADAVKQMKNNEFFEIFPTKALNEVVKVDFYIRGCPIRKEQFLYYVRRLSWMPLHPLRDMKFTVTPREGQEDSRSLVRFQPSKCILCRRCDVICCETLGVDALGLIGKGPETAISTPRNIGFDANGCIACGQCIAVCSCGALDTKSQVPDLLSALSSGKKMCAALDSSVLPSLAERDPYLYSMDPAEFESLVIGSLLSAGFAKVIPYDRYIMESVKADAGVASPNPRLSSWCRGTLNYAGDRIPNNEMGFSDRNAPWTLLLKHEKGPVCLITPCTAMKKEKGFGFVLSAMELDELFKRREIDLGFSTGGAYSEPVSRKGMHPGGGPSGIPGAVSCRIDRNLASKAKGHGLIDAYPCLHRCLSGGGNFPTSKLDIVKSRGEWLQHLWEVAK